MGNADFLGRGRVATVMAAPPPGTSPRDSSTPGIVGQFRGEVSDVMSGRLSLLMLDTIVIGIGAFYLWTRRAQGGG